MFEFGVEDTTRPGAGRYGTSSDIKLEYIDYVIRIGEYGWNNTLCTALKTHSWRDGSSRALSCQWHTSPSPLLLNSCYRHPFTLSITLWILSLAYHPEEPNQNRFLHHSESDTCTALSRICRTVLLWMPDAVSLTASSITSYIHGAKADPVQ